MKRYIAGLGLGALMVSIGMSCSSGDEEEGANDAGTDTPALIPDAGEPDVIDAGPCGEIIGLDSQECAANSVVAQSIETNILLVMDKSGSMADTPIGYEVDKWTALREALNATLTDPEVQSAISFGLEFFPTTATPGSPIPVQCDPPVDRCCEMPASADMNVNVGPGAETVPQIVSALNMSAPAGGTPTAIALARAYDYFSVGPGSLLTGGNYVLLATDGGPNCNPYITCTADTCTLNIDGVCPPDGFSCCDTYPPGCLDDTQTVLEIERLRDIGVTTIVVGIPGSELYEAALDAFAVAGGFAQTDAATSYYQVSPEGGVAELTQTFHDITIQLVRDCRIPLDVNWAEVNLNEVNVAVNCELVGYSQEPPTDDTASWWRWDNMESPSAVVIEGEWCNVIQDQGVERIDAVFGCPIHVIE